MSDMPNSYPKSLFYNQHGAVLIVVLLFLILIVLVGVIAVKQSTTDLKLATSDQINTLLLQSADNANQNIEQSINGGSETSIYRDMLSRSGPFGHFMLNADSNNHEYVFCFRPRNRFFDINKASILTPSGSLVDNGYCDPSKSDDYISARNASMAQVSISLNPPSPTDEPFKSYTIGQDSSEISSQAFTFDINSTAVLPAYADTKLGNEDCFKKTSRFYTVSNDKDTIGGCMAKAGVPSAVIYEMVNVENQSKRTKCVEFGKGSGKLCTLPTN
ncbi:PilX N-terminal domain-containing pilus assembly protein [Psychrobacter ciconiae]|uniref:PilX N-terminal domain-containing pilus assembly protein n=1 Tax=Psychrobacter ciconiae TaxID=1553449 RepID=UPI0019199A40|nr:PilX N-terminal domain-containing pilus assembly protein [Psychrobacter ciconiae]